MATPPLTIRINGKALTLTVTPSVKPGRVYTLFYLDGKRTAKATVADQLLAVGLLTFRCAHAFSWGSS